ncbi:MAG TPA: VCBS repeat-containing protein, partial [Longimicrobiales bacterium]|nr:VCBS repeat-containing protein [Longimicrobiales bacterium]
MRVAGRFALLVLVVLAVALLVRWLRTGEPPERIDFAAVQPDLFGAGRAVADAWADVDLDGDPDRFVGFAEGPARLYRNDGTSFTEVAAGLGLAVERSIRTAAWGDYDADGDPDLLLGWAGGAPVTGLYRNDGDAGFTEVAEAMGLRVESGTTRQASWVDYDGDGDLDLFLALRDGPNLLFRQDPSGTGSPRFVDVAAELGVDDPRHTVGAVWVDLDADGDLDLVTANMDGDANGVWRNDGTGFTDVAPELGVDGGGRPLGDETLGSVRVCAVDDDVDGDFDL